LGFRKKSLINGLKKYGIIEELYVWDKEGEIQWAI